MRSLVLFQALILTALRTAAQDLNPLAKHAPLVARECPADIKCAEPPALRQQRVFLLEPTYTTLPRLVVTQTTHTLTSYTFKAVVETEIATSIGQCGVVIYEPVTSRETLTVWVDKTTTSHYYTSTVELSVITYTHRVTETLGCFKEIDRSAPTPQPLAAPLGGSRARGGGTRGGERDLLGDAARLAGEAARLTPEGRIAGEVLDTLDTAADAAGRAGDLLDEALQGAEEALDL